jgi:hypothetical protein
VPTALDVVDGEVRELIRRRGLDPFTDPGPVRVLVRDVAADYRDLTAGVTGRSEAKPDSGQQGWPAAWGPHLLQELPAEPVTSTVRSL